MTHNPDNTRPPAPNLSPNELLTAIEFEHGGADTFEEAEHV